MINADDMLILHTYFLCHAGQLHVRIVSVETRMCTRKVELRKLSKINRKSHCLYTLPIKTHEK